MAVDIKWHIWVINAQVKKMQKIDFILLLTKKKSSFSLLPFTQSSPTVMGSDGFHRWHILFCNWKSCILVLTWLACFCLLQSCPPAAVLTLMNLLVKSPRQTVTSVGIAHMPLAAKAQLSSVLKLDEWCLFFHFSAVGFDLKPVC